MVVKLLSAFLAIMGVAAAFPLALILFYGFRDDAGASDVAIVLGSKVEAGGVPSIRLQARLDRAAQLYHQGLFAHVITSGGTGVEGYDEAAVMKDYLVRKGVPAAAILMDSRGVDTHSTAINSAALMKTHGFKSALVVSQYFHLYRSRYALRAQGIEVVHTARADFFELRDIYSIGREIAACYAYWLGLKSSAALRQP